MNFWVSAHGNKNPLEHNEYTFFFEGLSHLSLKISPRGVQHG